MNQLNSIILEGNIVAVEVGNSGVDFTISVYRSYKNCEGHTVEDVSEFHCYAYGNLAKSVEQFGKIGRGVRCVGRLKQTVWEQGGKKCSSVGVVCEHIEFKPFVEKKGD